MGTIANKGNSGNTSSQGQALVKLYFIYFRVSVMLPLQKGSSLLRKKSTKIKTKSYNDKKGKTPSKGD